MAGAPEQGRDRPADGRVRVIGHRGMGRQRPGARYAENSIPAFLAALAVGADGFELDVHLSADDEVIVHHDYRLGRATQIDEVGGRRMLAHLPARELSAVRLTGAMPATIPTLGEVLDAVRPTLGRAEVWVELKRQPPGRGRVLVERALAILARDPAWPQIVLRSYDAELLAEARRRHPDARAHLLSITRLDHGLHLCERHGLEGIAVHHALVRPEICAWLTRAGLTVAAGGEPGEQEVERIVRQAAEHGDIAYVCANEAAHAVAAARGRVSR